MCGIAGIFAYNNGAAPIDRAELARLREHMRRRGPDAAGAWFSDDGRIGLAHRRLSIIDLSEAGAQPMVSADRRFVVTFNGEIYNYRELREGLQARGYAFRSHSDTEVLLHLFAEKGEEMVRDLRGMFAFGIWSADKQELFLARDPYGIKPLYYADDGRTLRFASQVKALLAGGGIARDSDPAGWVGYYLFGSVPEPHTVYKHIKALPAGATLRVSREGARSPRRYHSIAAVYCNAALKNDGNAQEEERRERIRSLLLDSVRHHIVADVPVGAFLSGGIDSGALVGLMSDAGQRDIQTVTLAFHEFEGRPCDEAPLAADVARLYGAQHTNRVVTEEEFRSDLPLILEAMDQPTIDGVNTWFVSKAAHELGLKVAVSGVGGDELFGGYPSFRDIPSLVRWLALPARIPLLGAFFRRSAVAAGALTLGVNPKVLGMLEYGGSHPGAYLLRRGLFMPWELEQFLDRDTVRDGLRLLEPLDYIGEAISSRPLTAFAKVASLESALYMRNQLLRDSDWAGMAHSLEVRVPLVDSFLLHGIAPLLSSGRAGKHLLCASLATPLPRSVELKAKTGFLTPIGEWLGKLSSAAAGRKPIVPLREHWSRRWARFVHHHFQPDLVAS